MTILDGGAPSTGTFEAMSSVVGSAADGGGFFSIDYDADRKVLAVGMPYENRVTLLREPDVIFADDFQ